MRKNTYPREDRQLTARLVSHDDLLEEEEEGEENEDAAADDDVFGYRSSAAATHRNGRQPPESFQLKSRAAHRGTSSQASFNGLTSVSSLYHQVPASGADATNTTTTGAASHSHAKRRVYTDTIITPVHYEYVEWIVKPGDSLSSLSLKSGCTISHLKRVNNLINDQDFYALKAVRIPFRKNGMFADRLMETSSVDHDVGSSSQPKQSSSAAPTATADLLGLTDGDSQDGVWRMREDEHVSGHGVHDDRGPAAAPPNEAEKFIRNVDQQVSSVLSKLMDSENRTTVTGGTSSSAASGFRDYPLTQASVVRTSHYPSILDPRSRSPLMMMPRTGRPAATGVDSLHCDGADGGLSMSHVLLMAVVICILVPVIYIIFVEEHVQEQKQAELHHHHDLHQHDHQPLLQPRF